MDELAERYSDGEVGELDGISVDYDDWHFNVRPSNTEPLLRLNLESVSSRGAHGEKRDEVLGLSAAPERHAAGAVAQRAIRRSGPGGGGARRAAARG